MVAYDQGRDKNIWWHKVLVGDIRRVKKEYASLSKKMYRGYVCSGDD